MPWNAVTTADVLSEMDPAEKGLLEDVQGSTANLGTILTRALKSARGCVLAGGGRVDAEGTIADQLAPDIITITRWKWLLSLPHTESLQSDDRKDAFNAAMKRLDDIAAGKILVEVPATAVATTAPGNAIQKASGNTRRSTRDKLEGLI